MVYKLFMRFILDIIFLIKGWFYNQFELYVIVILFN